MNRITNTKENKVPNLDQIFDSLCILENSYNDSMEIIANLENSLEKTPHYKKVEHLKKNLSDVSSHLRMIKGQIE